MEPLKPKGRGARIMEVLQKARAAKPGGEEAKPGVETVPTEPPKPRGRAAILNKLKEMSIGGPSTSFKPVIAPTTVFVETPTAVAEPPALIKEEVEKATCSYQAVGGHPINVTANYVRLNVEKDKGVFEYEVRFDPPVDAKSARVKLINANLPALGNVKMFDGGACLYLPIRLPQERTIFNTPHPINNELIYVNIIYKKKKGFSDCLHLFNVLFKRVMSALQYSRVGRNYYDTKASKMIPQHRLEVLPGYAIAIDEVEGGLMICLDTQHRVLRTCTVLEHMYELRRANPDIFQKRATDTLLGSVVITKYNNKTYTIHEILWDVTPTHTFETTQGTNISYSEYYQNHYGIKIMEPSQPLLLYQTTRKVAGQAKEEDIRICLVPELCNLTGLTDEMRSDYKVMKDVAEFTRITPNQRMFALRKYLQNVKSSPQSQEILSGWGLQIEDGTVDIKARILAPETILFGDGQTFQSNLKADWSGAVAKNKVIGPVDLISWIIIYTERDHNTVQEYAMNMVRLSNTIGCRISQPRLHKIKNDRTATFKQACDELIHDNIQCVVFVAPTQRSDLYSMIKKITLVQKPIGCQVILSRNLNNSKKARTVTMKIALQINCKLGGSLWGLRIPVKSWMVCGIDVYHSPGNKMSWGALVSSINDTMTSYYTSVIQQEKELSDGLKMPFMKALLQHREKMGCFPTQVVVYRDGVGDGQIEHVKQYEIKQFIEGSQELEINNLKICYIIVQKRINTRLIEKSSMANPPPGTIVDTTITRKHFYDFFLVPQSVTQGTVTPIHYVVVYDSGQLKPDHVQKLTFKLCHIYYNWTGTIRVPAPCQYAHKVAFLVGQHIGKPPADVLSDKLYYL